MQTKFQIAGLPIVPAKWAVYAVFMIFGLSREAVAECGPELLMRERPLVYTWNGSTLEGWHGSAVPFENSGTSNAGLFLLTAPGEPARILRVTPNAAAGELSSQLSSQHGSKSGASSSADFAHARFLRQLQAMRLQEQFGGPQVIDQGIFVSPSGQSKSFVLLECLFCGQKVFNLKDAVYGEKNLISELEATQAQVLGRFADELARVIESRVLPVDPDFLVSASGELRWIDGERWQQVPRLQAKIYEFADAFWTVFEYSKRALSAEPGLWPEASQRFLGRFADRIEKSESLAPAEKAALFSQMLRGQAARDFRQLGTVRSIPPDEVEPLYREVLRFFRGRKSGGDPRGGCHFASGGTR